MFQSKWRLWNISISMLIFLTAYNIFLTIKLMYSNSSCSSNPPSEEDNLKIQSAPEILINCDETGDNNKIHHNENNSQEKLFEEILPRNKSKLNLDLGLGRSDQSLNYRLYDNILVGDKYVELNGKFKTCLATQSSLDKIVSIVESSLYWGGPISLAVFATDAKDVDKILLYLLYLRKCNKRIREKVTFHLALIEEKRPKNYQINEEKLEKLDCKNPIGIVRELVREPNQRVLHPWKHKLPYPQNLLRNLARRNCHTKFVFLTDVDIIPSKFMAESLNEFFDKEKCNSNKCAYVVPTYELDERLTFPENKTELIRMANKNLARPFHHKVFIFNQYATNFTRWQNFSDSRKNVQISHPVTNFEFLYEPFYIAKDNVPAHDERFIGYGYTRNSQVYEMFVAGYEFLVLSPIFTCHWGLQVKKTRPSWREHQNNLNRKQFDQFKKEIFSKYNKDPLNMMTKH